MKNTSYTRMSYAEVAPTYNQINFIPVKAAEQIGQAIANLTTGLFLDFGAGACRITQPVAETGITAIALDYEYAMLRSSADDAPAPTLSYTQGDVVHLPFADNSLDTVFTSNVLHLVEEWEKGLHEAARVLKPDGIFIIGRDVLDPNSSAGKLRSALRRIVGTLDPSMQPTSAAGPALVQAIGKIGGQAGRPVVAAEWTQQTSPAELLQRMRTRQQNETWALSDELLTATMVEVDQFATETFPNLEQIDSVQWAFHLMPIANFGSNIS